MMNWRTAIGLTLMTCFIGCRGHQFGHIINDDQQDLVGSHTAGASTFKPLIEESVGKLLARQQVISSSQPIPDALVPKRICFVGVENHSAEEIGDFKEQIYEEIDTLLLNSGEFSPISRRFVSAGLEQTRLRPDALLVPDNMRLFTAAMAQQGQPFDYLLFGKLTSGTTGKNKDYQRDYLLTLELLNVNTGDYDKESAKVRKGYHASRLAKLRNYNPFTRR